ncbi:hypothetical protein GCM10028821_27810 [Hymenobacter jeollabukensis]
MPDIWERPGAGPIDLPSFAPVWLQSSFGWNRPLMFGSVPAEIVSGQFEQRAKVAPHRRLTTVQPREMADTISRLAPPLPKERGPGGEVKNQQSKPFFAKQSGKR